MPLASDARPRSGAREGGKGVLRWSAPMVKAARPEPATRRRGTRPYAEDVPPETDIASRARGATSTSGRDRASGVRGGNRIESGSGVEGGDSGRVERAGSDHRAGDARTEEESFDRAFAALAEEMEKELAETSPSPAPTRVARRRSLHEVDRSLETATDASAEGLPDASSFRAASRAAIGSFIREIRGEDARGEDACSSPVFDPARGARARRAVGAPASLAASEVSDASHAPSCLAWSRRGGCRGGAAVVEAEPGTRISNANPTRAAFRGISLDPVRSRKGGVGAPFGDEPRRDDEEDEDILEAWRRRRRREAFELGDEASAAARASAAVAALEFREVRPEGTRRVKGSDVDDAVSRDPADSASRPPPPPPRTSPVALASSVASQTDADGTDFVATPSRARRSLEFHGNSRDAGRSNANASAAGRNLSAPPSSPPSPRRDARVPESATPSPRKSPDRNATLESAAEALDIAAALDVTVGDALFGDAFGFGDAFDAAPAPTPAASPEAGPGDGSAAAAEGRRGARGVVARLPPRPKERMSFRSEATFGVDSLRGVSPIEAVAAEAEEAAAAEAANARLPSRGAPRPPTAPRIAVASRDAKASRALLGEEWARPEDEDDGLVVALRARVENVKAQISRLFAESAERR